MITQLSYAIKYVGDMAAAVRFYQDHVGLKLRFQSPEWSEFETGSTTLALHVASPERPAGSCELGFRASDIDSFYTQNSRQGVKFTSPPTELHGQRIARFKDTDGAECSVGGT
jgi:predicted enzyme related to lactoylglutathione lyase